MQIRASKWLRRWRQTAGDLLLPPSCALCQTPLVLGRRPVLLCATCRHQIGPADLQWCVHCGHVFSTKLRQAEERLRCPWCPAQPFRFAAAYPLGSYDGLRRDAVLTMKQAAHQALAVHVGRLLGWRTQQRWPHDRPPDVIVPIPKHWLRRLWRGTNSAECLAEGISHSWDVPWIADGLRFNRLTEKQSLLSQSARRKNLRQAFSVSPKYAFADRSILLVDDLMTTGTTSDEAARALLAAGARRIDVAIVCRA